MNIKDFIKEAIGENILKDNKNIYQEILEKESSENITEQYWIKFKILYESLNESDKSFIFDIIKQIQIDTMSTFFSVIDGISDLESNIDDDEFQFTLGNENYTGYLQDTLLAIDEESTWE